MHRSFLKSLPVIIVFLMMIFIKPKAVHAQALPLPEGVGLSIKATSYGAEIYVPISVGEQWDIGLQYVQFWPRAYYSKLPEPQSMGLKARYFFSPSKTGHFIGMLIAANGFEDQRYESPVDYTPVLGASYGYELPLVKDWLMMGFEVEGGVGTGWDGYIGAGISLAFYH
ncbi:MAG TPA: DUF3575 domain-containing protein [Balneolaceae bacterium]|nr:DUF3575 domain-containing protein [Balneolaceae bacterium]